MTVLSEDKSLFAKEPQTYVTQQDMDKHALETHNERAEKLNGRFAMLGVIAALGAYAITGQIIPGVW